SAAADDDEKTRQLVIDFGSRSPSTGSLWLPSSVPEDDVRSEASQLSRAVCLPEEGNKEQSAKVCKVESVPAEPSSSADVSCASPDLEPLLCYFDCDYFGERPFDIVDEFINFDEITLLRYYG